jgi:hypothetical protein
LTKVAMSNVKVNACSGRSRRVAEPDVGPALANCGSTGCATPMPLVSTITKVTLPVVEPLLSDATKLKLAAPASWGPGVPEKVLVPLISCSQVGCPESVYDIRPSAEVNVESENTKIYGCDVRATGGTCAFTGNARLGFASTLGSRDSKHARRAAKPQ